MPHVRAFLVGAAVASLAGRSSADPPPSPPRPVPHLRAVRTPVPPVIDGSTGDDVWKLAEASGAFTQKVPHDGVPPTDPTTVRVLYDDDAVYVAFDCLQPHTPIVERLTRRDREVEVDAVWFNLGTRGDHKSSFEFYVNSSGTLADAIRFNDTDYSQDWDENWDARTKVGEHAWSAEFRIPLRVLRFPSLPVQSWDFQAIRYVSNLQETDEWSYYPRSEGGEVSHYGRLDGLERLHERAQLELRPFVVGRLRRRDPTVGQLASGVDFLASAGLDLKWHPTQDLTLDATFNPDFAQVEADQVVLNLSTAETYYPEKRPFFLEGIDNFTTPFQLLYTRRIGRVPPIPALRTDAVNGEQLVDVPEPAAIYGATKLTGRLGAGWSIGTIQAVTAADNVQVQLGSGARVSRRIDPTSTFDVMRVNHDLGDNAHIAFMASAVTHAETTSSYPTVAPGIGGPGRTELCPDPVQLTPLAQRTSLEPAPLARCFNDAYVGAVDWRWRSADGTYATGGQVASTVLENGPDRPVADGTINHPGDVGIGGKGYLNKEGGKHWIGGLTADLESRKFEVNDLGYEARANQLAGELDLEYRDLEPAGIFLETHLHGYFGTQYDARGLLIGQGTHLAWSARFKNFWNFYTDVYYRGNKFDDREVGDGTALQRDGAVGHISSLGTDPTRRVSLWLDQHTEAVFDGFETDGDATLTVRVLPQLDFDLLPTWQYASGEPRFMSTGAPGQYFFGKLDAKSVGLSLRTTYTFAPRLTLQGYAQLFLASGHYAHPLQYSSNPAGQRPAITLGELTPYAGPLPYNSDFEQGVLNVNLVLRWEYMLGSTLFLVYTRSQVPTTTLDANGVGALNLSAVGRAPVSDAILAKVSFWWGG